MNAINLELFDAEIKDIMNVLGQLPTQSNAWPLMKKIEAQLNAQLPVVQEASVVETVATPTA